MNKIINTLYILFLIFITGSTFSQTSNPFGFTCELPANAPEINQGIIGGQHKPERTDYSGVPNDAVFRVLVVFVQFANDPGPHADYWPMNGSPTYLENVVSQFKNTNYGSSWWDAYSETSAPLSDFWMEASRGHFHIVGKTVNVILPEEYTYYQTFGSRGIEKINDDIYAILQQDISIYWPDYDLWSKNGSGFSYAPDGKVDMIYKVHRSHSPLMGMPAGGIAYLYNSYSQGLNYKIYDDGNGTEIYINGNFGNDGSGLTMTPGHGYPENDPNYFRYAPMQKTGVVSFSEHEHGHYIFGSGHQKYGKMMGAGNEYGVDEFLSPYESIRLGYMNSIPAVLNSLNTIGDYSSRNSNSIGQVLEIPIDGSNEFFLIANRQRVSNYDRIMWGDTAHGDPYRVINPEYGKGIYIYHAAPYYSGYPYLSQIDNECADGLWNWDFSGYQHPDWSAIQDVDYFTRNSVNYDHNDNGGDGSLYFHDGKSLYNWFGLGKREYPLYQYGDGTDRYWTNRTTNFCNPTNGYEVWTSREWQGDRWDAWKVGYNEVFSPYSSPSTVDWNSQATGLFIYLESQNGNDANFRIYQTGNTYTEEQILEMTPPSKPMNIKVDYVYPYGEGNGPAYSRIRWNHNIEPDMLRAKNLKRYRIYRAVENDLSTVPLNYTFLATANINTANNPEFIDVSYPGECSVMEDGIHVKYPVRYKVQAIDKFDDESVLSDFGALVGIRVVQGGGGEEENRPSNAEMPLIFTLFQNYPNPFNPSTKISYDLPHSSLVTLKIYNVLGEEVAKLVNNEFKPAGSYSVTFDGSNFGSGIYFYSIEAGQYKETKKMVLIK